MKYGIPDVIAKRVHASMCQIAGYPNSDNSESGNLLAQAMILCQEFAAALSENPIAPTMAQAGAMRDSGHPCILDGVWYATEWQRRMFLAPREPEVPEEIKDLLVPARNLDEAHAGYGGTVFDHNHDVLEAFRRGQERILNPPKCGESVTNVIAGTAGTAFFPCALPKGHYGGHRAEGICVKHGPYFGKNNAVPECPECAKPPFTAEQILRTNREVLNDDSNL